MQNISSRSRRTYDRFVFLFNLFQKHNWFFNPTFGCWNSISIHSRMQWFRKRKPTTVRADFFFFYWHNHPELRWLVYSIEKKKNHHEQKLKKEANSCSGWFFSFSIDIPIMNYMDWCLNREKEKSPWTEVGFLLPNHFIDSCSFSSFQKAKALDCGSNGSRDIEFLPSLTPFKKLWVPQPQPIIYRLGLRDSKFFFLTKLSQHPKVWFKNGLHFWTHRKILIKSKTFRFLHHDDHDDHDHDHHDHHDTKI